MHSLFLFATALAAASTTVATSVPLAARDCGSVPGPQQSIMDQIYQVCLEEGLSEKLMLAVFETADVESGYNNLPCGNLDSLGVFQQRPSQGWCDNPADCMNVHHATVAFINALKVCASQHPSEAAGTLAQCVQGSQFPDRYNEEQSTAQHYLDETIARMGGSAGAESAPPKKKPAPPKTTSKKTTTTTTHKTTTTSASHAKSSPTKAANVSTKPTANPLAKCRSGNSRRDAGLVRALVPPPRAHKRRAVH